MNYLIEKPQGAAAGELGNGILEVINLQDQFTTKPMLSQGDNVSYDTLTVLPNGQTESEISNVTYCLSLDSDIDAEIANLVRKTENTYSHVSNGNFMGAIFDDLSGDQRPVTCGFPGHPKNGKWFGRPWYSDGAVWDSFANNYFTLSTFAPDSEGTYRRQKPYWNSLHAVMLDDIGTKVDPSRLTIPPSWQIETSPGNFQAGYIFAEPVTEKHAAEGLMKAIINAGLCDPGADGPLTRYARLPEGINGKHEPPFQCRLTEWRQDLKYTIEQIADGLQLDYSPGLKNRSTGKVASNRMASESDDIFVDRPDENPVIATLKERGLYKSPLGSGKHDITCPWCHEHTDEVDNGTAYFEPDESYPRGGFKCLHGHCSDRHIRELLDFLGISQTEAKHRSIIRVTPGELASIVNHSENVLASSGKYYQLGGLIVSVTTEPGTKETSAKALSQPSMARALSNLASFVRFDKRLKRWLPCDPPERHCRVLFDSEKYPHIPVLNGLARQPYLRPDGSLMKEPGYDPATGMFGVFASQDFSIKEAPTKTDAANALKMLTHLLSEFKFKDRHDLAAALSAILTAAIRPALPLAPLFHIVAPQIASGKSYLTSIITSFATPTAGSALSYPANEEECQKLLMASLLTAPSVICFDNLTSDLIPHKSLCSSLTEEHITGRILGVSKTATVGTRTLFLSSGNNVYPVRDMTRRTVTITLDPACERPTSRTFKKKPLEIVRKNRGRWVSQALTIVRAWIVAGRPCSEVKSLATYSDWSDLCRQPLLWLDQPDPAVCVFNGMDKDPDRETLGLLLHNWHKCFADRPTMIRDAMTKGDSELREIFFDIAGERGDINRKKLGRWISRHAGRIVDGKQFEKDSSTRSAEAWRVKSVTSVITVSTPPQTKNVSE